MMILYSARALSALFAALLALTASGAHAAEVTVTNDVVYGSVGGSDLKLDVYRPGDGAAPHAAVLLIHGGGWVMGDKGWYARFGRELARDGFVAFAINYRLAPQVHYPAPIDDAQRAVRWVRLHAAAYAVDPDRVAALGDSAGAYLAEMLGTMETRDNGEATLAGFSSHVQAVVDLYGPADFTAPAADASGAAMNYLRQYFGKEPTSDPKMLREASPVTHVDNRSARFLILHGTGDTLVPIDQSVRLFSALKAAGTQPEMFELYGMAHGFFVPFGPPPDVTALIVGFLQRTLATAVR